MKKSAKLIYNRMTHYYRRHHPNRGPSLTFSPPHFMVKLLIEALEDSPKDLLRALEQALKYRDRMGTQVYGHQKSENLYKAHSDREKKRSVRAPSNGRAKVV